MSTYKPKSSILKFRVHDHQKKSYKRAAKNSHVSKWALPILDAAAQSKGEK